MQPRFPSIRQTAAANEDGAPIPFIDAATVAARTPYPLLIEALRRAFLDPPPCPRRIELPIEPTAASPAGQLLVMPIVRGGGLALVKLVTVHPSLGDRPGGALRSIALALDAATGETIALIDGHTLTVRRTAATSALAARTLTGQARRLAILGAGAVAEALAHAYAATFALDTILIWARRDGAAEALAARLREAGLPARAADRAAAIRGADVVTAATLATEPLIAADMVKPGAHIDLVGGFRADMQEADPALVAAAEVTIDGPAALDAGDLARPIAAGLLDPAAIATLTERLRAPVPPRLDRITLFKSVGLAIEDLAAAELVIGR